MSVRENLYNSLAGTTCCNSLLVDSTSLSFFQSGAHENALRVSRLDESGHVGQFMCNPQDPQGPSQRPCTAAAPDFRLVVGAALQVKVKGAQPCQQPTCVAPLGSADGGTSRRRCARGRLCRRINVFAATYMLQEEAAAAARQAWISSPTEPTPLIFEAADPHSL